MVGIYKITNTINNKVYIGSTLKSFDFRFKTHINLLRRNRHENPILQKSWNKYSENCFVFETVESFNNIYIEELLNLEKYYILKYCSANRNYGYNICAVGKSRYGTKWSEESKKNRCGSGNPMFEKGHLREGELNPMFGKTLTETHKKRMSKSLTGLKKPITSIKLSKPVIQLDKIGNVLNEFSSAIEIKDKLGFSPYNCLTGRSKTAGGYCWKYK